MSMKRALHVFVINIFISMSFLSSFSTHQGVVVVVNHNEKNMFIQDNLCLWRLFVLNI